MTEDEERQERINAEAGTYFWPLVRKQRQRFSELIYAIAPYRGSPRWDREKAAIDREWQAATAEAERVYHMAIADLDATGEVSEATSYAYDEVEAKLTQKEIAA